MSQEPHIEVRFEYEFPVVAGADEVALISAMLPELLKIVQQIDNEVGE